MDYLDAKKTSGLNKKTLTDLVFRLIRASQK